MSGWNRLPGRGNAGGTIGLRTRGQLVDAVARVEHVFDFLADKVFPPVDAVRVDRVQRARSCRRERRSRRVLQRRSATTTRRHTAGRNVFIATLNAESEQFIHHE